MLFQYHELEIFKDATDRILRSCRLYVFKYIRKENTKEASK